MGPRELAQAVELNQQYVDILEEMEAAPVNVSVTVKINENRVKFDDIDDLADWMAEVMD